MKTIEIKLMFVYAIAAVVVSLFFMVASGFADMRYPEGMDPSTEYEYALHGYSADEDAQYLAYHIGEGEIEGLELALSEWKVYL